MVMSVIFTVIFCCIMVDDGIPANANFDEVIKYTVVYFISYFIIGSWLYRISENLDESE